MYHCGGIDRGIPPDALDIAVSAGIDDSASEIGLTPYLSAVELPVEGKLLPDVAV